MIDCGLDIIGAHKCEESETERRHYDRVLEAGMNGPRSYVPEVQITMDAIVVGYTKAG